MVQGVDPEEPLLYHLKITLLKGSLLDRNSKKTDIWRRVIVPDSYTLGDLHLVIQDAMGWKNYHLHMFETPDGETIEQEEDEDYTVHEVFSKNKKIEYTYDFGDNWVHLIERESVKRDVNDSETAVCTEGNKAGPPEDVGSILGHEELVRILADKNHEEFAERKEWLDECGYIDYDPNRFEMVGPVGPGPRPVDSYLYQLKISLTEPTELGAPFYAETGIWRRILITGSQTLKALHNVIQKAMGWRNCHLHEFVMGNGTHLVPNKEDIVNKMYYELEENFSIEEVFETKQPIKYVYDMGDQWEHVVVLERVIPNKKGLREPISIGGQMACPPEDCGGVPGYHHLLKTIGDPQNPEYKEMKAWLRKCGYDDYNPKHYNI